ncbi:polar amino acid transport system substrate-binding protein [Mesorhizobium shonense]|uniref:Polar amino acid transport system substrate-binding protein n=1 Tax=Mesorhizobium shonense TaxID=1209948 RepID=A0ABV2I2G9_9HYPH|nr:transporter substrate-binding domain-containing protein [Mesorhizobium sp.]TIS49180.1 MAG: transporter substrate-binding domain-containing protein [Mesorhizobium sp.]
MAIPSREVVAELAPNGTIRAAINAANAALVQVDPSSGEIAGPSSDIARRLGSELGAQVSLVRYPTAGGIMAAIDRDEWDIALIAEDPSRADRLFFSPPYAIIAATYAVRVDLPCRTSNDVDASGVRIATARSAAYTSRLERLIKRATLVYADDPSSAFALMVGGECDAAAGIRESLARFAVGAPGVRVVDGAFSEIKQTIAIRHGSPQAAAHLTDFTVRYMDMAEAR